MDDSSLTVPSFYVDELSGPFSYDENDDEEAQYEEPSVSIATTERENTVPPADSQVGDDAVFATSSTEPQLRHRPLVPFRRDRTQSAPTLMEHEIGLALRSISDEFNDIYVQQTNQRRRASHPDINNHHGHGLRRLWRRFSRGSWIGSSTSSESAATDGTSYVGPTQRLSAHSIPEEEEEEAVVRESN